MKYALQFTLPLALMASAANATTFMDRTAFNAAVMGVVNNDLNGLPAGPVTTVFGVETISSGGFAGGGLISNYGNGFGNALGGANGAGGVNNFDSVIFTFNAPIYAFGFDDLDLTGGTSEYANVRVNLVGGGSELFSFTDPDNLFTTGQFFGFASATALQSVEIWSSNDPGGAVGGRANLIDNLAISRIAPGIPEPGTWAMMIFGFGMAGAAMRQKRRTNVKLRYA
ncbi:MAG: PEPxxWA-CTERM sorting domain-containing protein [Parasphingorhabdus sp.]|nr:PEPxxWA-CTERM sorting domain-containing protein [Parasphingorhabdus sp.]